MDPEDVCELSIFMMVQQLRSGCGEHAASVFAHYVADQIGANVSQEEVRRDVSSSNGPSQFGTGIQVQVRERGICAPGGD